MMEGSIITDKTFDQMNFLANGMKSGRGTGVPPVDIPSVPLEPSGTHNVPSSFWKEEGT
jgi:hypothetical protein